MLILKESQTHFYHTYNQTVSLWGVPACVLAKAKRCEILEGTALVIVQGKGEREGTHYSLWRSKNILKSENYAYR